MKKQKARVQTKPTSPQKSKGLPKPPRPNAKPNTKLGTSAVLKVGSQKSGRAEPASKAVSKGFKVAPKATAGVAKPTAPATGASTAMNKKKAGTSKATHAPSHAKAHKGKASGKKTGLHKAESDKKSRFEAIKSFIKGAKVGKASHKPEHKAKADHGKHESKHESKHDKKHAEKSHEKGHDKVHAKHQDKSHEKSHDKSHDKHHDKNKAVHTKGVHGEKAHAEKAVATKAEPEKVIEKPLRKPVKAPKAAGGKGRRGGGYGVIDESVCREVACDGLSTTAGYCRLHYIKNWKKLKRKEVILKEKKLNQYIEELVLKYPEKYIEAIRIDLASEKEFAKVIRDLDLDESIDDFEGEGDAEDNIIDSIRRDFDEDTEGF